MILQDLLQIVTEAENSQITAIKKQIADVNAQIEEIIGNGGKVTLTDPLSVKLVQLRKKLKNLKRS